MLATDVERTALLAEEAELLGEAEEEEAEAKAGGGAAEKDADDLADEAERQSRLLEIAQRTPPHALQLALSTASGPAVPPCSASARSAATHATPPTRRSRPRRDRRQIGAVARGRHPLRSGLLGGDAEPEDELLLGRVADARLARARALHRARCV